ncbi:response regulator transcription factor [Edaphocola aurantiacus]|uniref:response regulator transcription factor n=1 Tax=Edaphocola aurantiacus TaxID=2601682 RepID=UPI001C949C62|nr:response regulator transcription factor [Edaphocola aurantiacus]
MENKINILIIEDDALIAEHLKYTLEDLGYYVSGICYHFDEARDLIAHTEADLILLDINLEEAEEWKNGIALGGIIQDTRPNIPFIYLTAYNDLNTIRAATRQKPQGYLIKPAGSATLFAAIQTAIENNNLQQKVPETDQQEEARPDYFFVKVGHKTNKFFWKDIYCLEAGKNYVKVKSAQVQFQYSIRGSLTFVRTQLLPLSLQASFVQVNRSCCVNLQYMTSFDPEAVYFGTERIENSRMSMADLKKYANNK